LWQLVPHPTRRTHLTVILEAPSARKNFRVIFRLTMQCAITVNYHRFKATCCLHLPVVMNDCISLMRLQYVNIQLTLVTMVEWRWEHNVEQNSWIWRTGSNRRMKILHTENSSHLSVWNICGQYLFQYWMEVFSNPQYTKKIVINLIFI
jgi:hypothetical protein